MGERGDGGGKRENTCCWGVDKVESPANLLFFQFFCSLQRGAVPPAFSLVFRPDSSPKMEENARFDISPHLDSGLLFHTPIKSAPPFRTITGPQRPSPRHQITIQVRWSLINIYFIQQLIFFSSSLKTEKQAIQSCADVVLLLPVFPCLSASRLMLITALSASLTSLCTLYQSFSSATRTPWITSKNSFLHHIIFTSLPRPLRVL